MKYDEEDKRSAKRPKHRPNQKGVGMRTLNEHDADSYDDYLQPDEGPVDEGPQVFLNEHNEWQMLDK